MQLYKHQGHLFSNRYFAFVQMAGKNISLHVATLSVVVVVAWPRLSHDLSRDCEAEPARKTLRKLLNLASLCCDPGNNPSLYAQTEAVEQNSTACVERS